jgi:hypothetical protein
MKNLDEVGGFVDTVINQDGGMHELADAGPSVHRAADVREAF